MKQPPEQKQDLAVLKLSMARSVLSESTHVIFELEVDGKTVVEGIASPDDIGLPINLQQARQSKEEVKFSLPRSMIRAIQQGLKREGEKNIPLWLKFISPSGYLPLVPWEPLLQSSLKVPILRFPYYALQPVSSPDSLDIVLCASILPDNPQQALTANWNQLCHVCKPSKPVLERISLFSLVVGLLEICCKQLLDNYIQKILTHRKEQTTIHLFTDESAYAGIQGIIKERLASLEPGSVTLYNLQEVSFQQFIEDYNVNQSEINLLDNFWLRWIKAALSSRSRSADIVHFLGQGDISQEKGLFVSSLPFSHADQQQRQWIDCQQLTTFLTQIGAWSVGFSSLLDNRSGLGLRLLADQLARLRPGCVFLHDIVQDIDGEALAKAYRFLYSEVQTDPPCSPAVSLYSNPRRLSESKSEINDADARQALKTYTLAKGATQKILDSKENTPSWIAASQRYLEQLMAEAELDRQDSDSSPSRRGTEEALKMISELIERHISTTEPVPSPHIKIESQKSKEASHV
jgi:hypothetical protein